MTLLCWNHGYVIIVLNNAFDSSIRFCNRNSVSYYTHDCVSWYLVVWLKKNLIIFGECHQKYDGSHILKTVNPFPSFWSLTAHINHSETEDILVTPNHFCLPIYIIIYILLVIDHLWRQMPTEESVLYSVYWLNLKTIPSKSNGYSMIPVVGTLDLRMSCSVGR